MREPDLRSRAPSAFVGVIGMGASRTEQPAPTELPHGLPPLGYLQEIRLYDDDPSPPSVVIVNANVR